MTPRLAVLADFPEEGWPSMDLCGEMLLSHLPREGPLAVDPSRLRPGFLGLAGRLPAVGRLDAARNLDRLLNRFVSFPSHARREARRFDAFHVVDHSYAQLVHSLPAGRAGVYCHDLDAFGCLLGGGGGPRPRWFRALARRILAGLQEAAIVFHNTVDTGEALLRHGLVPGDRLVHAPLGVAPEFAPGPPGPGGRPGWLDELDGRPVVLHVGSCIPRKRVDLLLEVVAAVREAVPGLRLLKVGGEWAAGHRERIARWGLAGAIRHVRGLSRGELAEAYRRADVVMVTSESEGFGLPVIEALACGSAVVASAIPALREAGGPAAGYAPVGDVGAWAGLVSRWLEDPSAAPPPASRLAWASRFTWAAHAEAIASAYREIGSRPRGAAPGIGDSEAIGHPPDGPGGGGGPRRCR